MEQIANYRSDIDGLRAVAVLAVVLYHYNIGPLHGGFVGVDIFFVISGYLITGIIVKELELGRFTFSRFYERRIRRIFPALFSMLLVTLAVGVWSLLPSDVVSLGNATIATVLFSSNVLFWRQSGYFDSSSEFNLLLHTWSLAVEEQFYIGLPILLAILHRFAKSWLKSILITCALISFVLCVWLQEFRPSAAFFLAPFRAWELLLGSMLAIGSIPPIRSDSLRFLASIGALVTLLASLWWIKAGTAFPGWLAAIPAVATAALLHAGEHGISAVQRLLSLKPLVFFGLISYSLYLWHWPLVVLVRYRDGMSSLVPSTGWILLAMSIALATASYLWIETPFRRRKANVPRMLPGPVLAAAASISLLTVSAALVARLDGGWRSRHAPEIVALDAARHPAIPFVSCDGQVPDLNSSACRIGAGTLEPRVLLWGDSHALAWAPAFNALLKQRGIGGVLAFRSACPPLLKVSNVATAGCKDFNDQIVDWVARTAIRHVILVSSWLSYSEPHGQYALVDHDGNAGNLTVFSPALNRTISALSQRESSIVIIGPTPGAPSNIPFRAAIARLLKREMPREISVARFQERAKWFRNSIDEYGQNPQIKIVDPMTWFCDYTKCRYVNDSGELLYRDGGHLSLTGAEFVAAHFPIETFARQSAESSSLQDRARK